jgi:CPA2 family monovalent cation:H+ antiporter-2
MEIPLLDDITIIFLISIAVLFIGHRFRVPAIVGFLMTGVLTGPYGLGFVQSVHEVEALAEIGIILLLFAIGMEFSFESLLQIKRTTLLGGSLQVIITLLTALFIALEIGRPIGEAIFIGFVVSLSSTAIVLKLIQERAEIDSPHGRTTLGILIFQDIIIVPMMLFIPLLAGSAENLGSTTLILLIKGIAIIGLVIISAKWIVPNLLYQIVRLQSREIFLLSIILICLTVAWITSNAGLSLALGAFLAGLIISESEYSYQALGNILPLRDIFTSFFFVSIGMLLNVGLFLERPVLIVLIALGVLALKSLIAGFVTVLLGYPIRTAVLVGVALSQIGEFSFILSKTGVAHGLLTGDNYQLFLAVSLLTMAATPFVMALGPRVSDFVLRFPLLRRSRLAGYPAQERADEGKKNHIIIIGFGFVGRNLTRAARVGEIPYLILEVNPEIVRDEKAHGEPIYYGDATQEMVLNHAGIKNARVVVVAVSDSGTSRRIVEVARRLNSEVNIIARTRYLQESKLLYALGADEVIPEEFETSVEVFTRVLRNYQVPAYKVGSVVAAVRSHGYEEFRDFFKERGPISDLRHYLPDVEIGTAWVGERSHLVGRSLAQIGLREKYSINVLAIVRDSQTHTNLTGDVIIYAEDVLLLLGTADKVAEISDLLRNPVER